MSRQSSSASMRATDVLGLSLSALGQQKVRTLLTLAGIVIGTFTLVVSLAVGRGVDRAIVGLFQEDDRIRKIEVSPKYEPAAGDIPEAEREPRGLMSDARRKRLRKAILQNWDRTHDTPRKQPLTVERMNELARLEHVESARPWVFLLTKASFRGKSEPVSGFSLGNQGHLLQRRLVAGGVISPDRPRGVVVDEFLLYRWGITDEADVGSVVGQSFQLESPDADSSVVPTIGVIATARLSLSKDDAAALERALRRLGSLIRFLPMPRNEREVLLKLLVGPAAPSKEKPAAPFHEEFTIVGVVRRWADDDPKPPANNWGIREADVYLPTEAAAAFHLRTTRGAREGFDQAELTADDLGHVKELAKKVESLGYAQYSFAEFIDTVRMNVLMVTFATAFVAFVALLVAALGITNTMIMSVLERTHEIGIMKALGARTGHIRLIFLVEGAILGLSGGLLGVFLGYLASFPGDSIAKSIMEPQTQTPVKGSLFSYPLWLVVGAPALAALITTLAAVYPAHRAASVDPITSLRHE